MKQIEEQAKAMGPWDSESQLVIDANTNVFEKNGWNSDADRFSLDLINQVSADRASDHTEPGSH